MNSVELKEQLYKVIRENNRFTWAEKEGIVNAILNVYMVRGLEFDFVQALNSAERLNRTGLLSF